MFEKDVLSSKDMGRHQLQAGFTLAELLIALSILGVIATFTVPKVLQSQQSSRNNAVAKETAGMLSGALQSYTFANAVQVTMTVNDLTPYMNYVNLDTARTIDNKYGSTTLSCNVSGGGCLMLHNGAALRYNGSALVGTSSTNAFEFILDPDGIQTDASTDGPGKSVNFFLYPTTGRIVTRGTTLPNTVASGTTYASPAPSADPPWFGW